MQKAACCLSRKFTGPQRSEGDIKSGWGQEAQGSSRLQVRDFTLAVLGKNSQGRKSCLNTPVNPAHCSTTAKSISAWSGLTPSSPAACGLCSGVFCLLCFHLAMFTCTTFVQRVDGHVCVCVPFKHIANCKLCSQGQLGLTRLCLRWLFYHCHRKAKTKLSSKATHSTMGSPKLLWKMRSILKSSLLF